MVPLLLGLAGLPALTMHWCYMLTAFFAGDSTGGWADGRCRVSRNCISYLRHYNSSVFVSDLEDSGLKSMYGSGSRFARTIYDDTCIHSNHMHCSLLSITIPTYILGIEPELETWYQI